MTLFSLTPTFTQGLVLGQISILLLLAFILRYLFFDTHPLPPDSASDAEEEDEATEDDEQNARKPLPVPGRPPHATKDSFLAEFTADLTKRESVEWFNFLLDGIAKAYRADLRGNLPGTAGNEAARRRVEKWAQAHLSSGIMAPIKVHSVNLGTSAPRLSNARIRRVSNASDPHTDLDITYKDTISMSVSTSLLFNYPTALFARLPISLTLSLSIFSGTVTLIPPTSDNPSFTLRLLPTFKLTLDQSSLMGSRAKLSDVPKVHQMIEERIRAAIATRFDEYHIMLPGIASRDNGQRTAGGEGMRRRTVDVYVEK